MSVSWASDFPTGWQYSGNSGATWSPAATSYGQVVGPTGTQRFRVQFTIPALPGSATWTATFSGDIHAGVAPAQVYYDGVLQGAVDTPNFFGPETFTLPADPGAHTLELWIGQANGAGATAPTVTLAQVTGSLPCDCCPTGEPACAVAAQRFDSAAQTTAEANWNPTNVAATADGVTNTTALSGYTTNAGATIPSTALRVTYTITPQNRVRGLRLWNQGGGDLTDADGLGTFTAEFYAGATLLDTRTWNGTNGGAPQSFYLPGSAELNGVDSVVLRSLGTQGGAPGVRPLWRELQLLEYKTVFPCRRDTGTLEWYDTDGNLVPSTDVVSCDGGLAVVPDLRMTGSFFGDDPGGTGENLCAVSPAPSATTGFNPPSGGCYDPTAGAPTITWTNVSSINFTYGGPNPSGAVWLHFASPTLGNITWPVNNQNMAVGESRLSNPFGGGLRAMLTVVSHSGVNYVIYQDGGDGGTRVPIGVGAIAPISLALRLDILAA